MLTLPSIASPMFARAALLSASVWALLPAAQASDGLRLEPQHIVLSGEGATQRLLATAFDDAGERDVTAGCAWSSSDEAVLSVDSAVVTASAPGRALVSVRCGDLTASQPVEVRPGGDSKMQVQFAAELLSILTTKGCNSSGCHGSPAGQNGFKLSLYGADPEADHRMIVELHDGRRVNLDNPEESLILQKPTFQIAHGGGQLLSPDEDAYRTILQWLEQGAPFTASGATLERLEIRPEQRILVGEGARQPLVVVGRLTDGSTKDMTDRVRFQVGDEAVVSAVEDGGVRAKSRGRTTVLARAMGKTASAELIVIDAAAGAEYPVNLPANFIDARIFAKLRQVNIRPRPLASDHAFVRRAFLDLVGMLPTPEEAVAFVHDSRPRQT